MPDLVHFVSCVYQDCALDPVPFVVSVLVPTHLYEQLRVLIVDSESVFLLCPKDGSKRPNQQALNEEYSDNIYNESSWLSEIYAQYVIPLFMTVSRSCSTHHVLCC
jgi:hypothetical protein